MEEEMKIKWIEIKDEGGLVSAATTLDNALRQFNADRIVAMNAIFQHVQKCFKCNKIPCKNLVDIGKQVEERFKMHKGLIQTLRELNSINRWYKPSPDEPSIMHELSSVMEFHGALKK